LLEDELAWQDSPAIFNQIRQYLVDVIFRIHFCLLLNEVELSFTTVAHTSRHLQMTHKLHGNRDRPVAKLSFFSSDSCNFCFMWMIRKKFSENTAVFLSIIWCKFQEFKLHGFREIEFFLGGCFLCRTLYKYQLSLMNPRDALHQGNVLQTKVDAQRDITCD